MINCEHASSWLFGKTILVTRPEAQASALRQSIEAVGGQVLHLPMLALEPLAQNHWSSVKACLQALSSIEIAIFISVNAVNFTAECLAKAEVCLPKGCLCLGIGAATAQAIQAQGWSVGEVPVVESSAGLLDLSVLKQVQNKQVALFKGLGGLNTLEEKMIQRGAHVKTVELYQRVRPEYAPSYIKQQFIRCEPSAAVFASGETLENFVAYAKSDNFVKEFQATPVIVPSDRVAALAQEAGCATIIVTKSAGVQSMMEGLSQVCSSIELGEERE